MSDWHRIGDDDSDGRQRATRSTAVDVELRESLERVLYDGRAQCRLCGRVVERDDWGGTLDALAEHAEDSHGWDDRTGRVP